MFAGSHEMMVDFAHGHRIDLPKFSVTWISANIYRILLPGGSWQLGVMSNEKKQICFGNGTSINCWTKMVRSAINITACSVAVTSSTEACSRFFALVAARPSFASVSTRDSAPVGSATLPVYSASGGPQGKGHVTFNRTLSQYLDAGPRTLNIATNGGLTIVAVARFTGTAASGNYERIIDLGSGAEVNNLVVSRKETAPNLLLSFRNGGSEIISSTLSGVIVQDTWLTAVVRYRASTRKWWFTVNGVAASTGTASASLADRTPSLTYMGRSQWPNLNGGGDAYLNGDIAGVFVVDEHLSTDATSAIADAMVRGVDLTETSGWTDFSASGYNIAAARTLSGGLLL
jgi:hypothetical protein